MGIDCAFSVAFFLASFYVVLGIAQGGEYGIISTRGIVKIMLIIMNIGRVIVY